jgi:hypothetical protein
VAAAVAALARSRPALAAVAGGLAAVQAKACSDEVFLSFCLPQFSFIWRIPIRGPYSSAE